MSQNPNAVNFPSLGMIKDVSASNLKEHQYADAFGAVIEGRQGEMLIVQNEPSSWLHVQFPAGYKVIGRLPVQEQDRAVFFLVNPTSGQSEIGEVLYTPFVDTTDFYDVDGGCAGCSGPHRDEQTPLEQRTQTPYGTYNTLVNAACLAFSLDHPVRAQYKITAASFNLYFVDRLNQRRYLYFDYSAGLRSPLVLQDRFKVITGYTVGDCKEPVYGTALDCNKTLYHPVYNPPCLKRQAEAIGGNLKAGVYQFFVGYSDSDGNPLTQYFPASNPFPVWTKALTVETAYTTNKAIRLDFADLDGTALFTHYNVVVAETIDNFTEFKLVGTYPVTQSTLTYTGQEQSLKKLSPDDVFFRRVFYRTAGNITKSNNYLFFSDLAEWAKPNLQRVANKVKLYWQTVAAPESVYRNPRFSEKFRGYPRDEVVPFGIQFLTDVGEELGTYHIPGPSKAYLQTTYALDVDAPVSNFDVIDRTDCVVRPANCCPPETLSHLPGTVTLGCSDDECTHQGQMVLQFNFTSPTPEELHLELGQVWRSSMSGQKFSVGYSIYPQPAGTTQWTYYANPQRPFVVTIPAGVTSYEVGEIWIKDRTDYDTTHNSYIWICHTCLEPTTDLWIKTLNPGLQVDLTNSQGVAIHTVDSVAVQPEPGCDPCTESYSNSTWKVYNTALKVGSPHEVLKDCDEDKLWEWGEFSYWESTEKYPMNPQVWGELCGQPIRHHKFPDSAVTHIHDGLNGGKGFSDGNLVFPLGVRVDHQSVIDALDAAVSGGVISAADRSRIRSYRIVRGNRVGHKSIVAKGLIYDMWNYQKHGNTYHYPNYPYNDLRPDNFISPVESTYQGGNNSDPTPNTLTKTGRYTFHSPDVHFTNPTLGTELKLETVEYGTAEGFFNHADEQARYKFLSTAAVSVSIAAGIAAAFSATKEKECVTYRKRANTEVDASNGSAPYANTSADWTNPGAGTLFTTGGSGTFNQGDQTYNWNNKNFTPYDKTTGQPIGVPEQIMDETRTTCKGTPYQLLSPASGFFASFINIANQALYLGILSLKEAQIIQDLIKALTPLKNFAVQYNSVGKYNNYQVVANGTGNKIRPLLRSAYLEPAVQLVDEEINGTTRFTRTYINNWNRERSVYLRLDPTHLLPDTAVEDKSRGTLDAFGLSQEELNKRVYTPIASYYAALKTYVPDQYGAITNVVYLPTGCCAFRLDTPYPLGKTGVFGGDTFISRFALKRKMPFFLQTRFRAENEGDVKYSELGNVGYPNYYFNTEQALMERLSGNTSGGGVAEWIVDLLGVANTRLDAKRQKLFYQSGFIHLYNYGVPYFFCESDVNVDYRIAHNDRERDFYPHNQDLDTWLQEKNVPITEDNYYLYNTTYSKQNHEAVLPPQVRELVAPGKLELSGTAIHSEEDFTDSKVDRWLLFKANNRKDFPAGLGRIIGLDGIENDKVLVRFENTSLLLPAYISLQTSEGEVKVGNGGIFNSRPQEFSSTKLGYAGTQHHELLQTEFGHLWVDARRGNVFVLKPGGGGMDEIGKDGLKAWLRENLPFQIQKDFPTFDTRDGDNAYKGVGLTMAFDKRFSRILITKRDYKTRKTGIHYDNNNKTFSHGGQVVSLDDPAYFCNRSWTLSYNFQTQSWVSYHAYRPHFYTERIDHFQSGFNDGQASLWSHGVSQRSFQVFNGKLTPFSIQVAATPMMLGSVLSSVSYLQDAVRYHGDQDTAHAPLVTFNKAVVFNDTETSGELVLHVRDERNFHQMVQYPTVENGQHHILVTKDRELWCFNQFWNTVAQEGSNLPLFLSHCNNCERDVNLKALDFYKPDVLRAKIRGRQTKVQLTQDQHSNYQFRFYLVIQERENG